MSAARLVYCCDQDHGGPSTSPREAARSLLKPTPAPTSAVISTADVVPSPSSSTTSLRTGSLGRQHQVETSPSSVSSCPVPLSAKAGSACSDAGCEGTLANEAGGVFDCCGLPLSGACTTVDADGCLACPDCRSPTAGSTCAVTAEDFACDLDDCADQALVNCSSPGCVAQDVPCFDESCDELCGAIECEVDHGPVASSDVLDCCGHEHSWACEAAPPLFGDFDQLLDCCPPHLPELSPTQPNGLGLVLSAPSPASASDPSSVAPPAADASSQLSAFQALIDAAISGQTVTGASGQASPASFTALPQPQPPQSSASSFNTPPVSAPTDVAGTSVPCLWSGCDETFSSVDLLLDHFKSTASHLPSLIPPALPLAPNLPTQAQSQTVLDQDWQAFQQSQALFTTPQAQALAQQGHGQQQSAQEEAQTTQEILDYLSSHPPHPPSSAGQQPSSGQSQDAFSVQCQWGGQPHSFTLADLLPPPGNGGIPQPMDVEQQGPERLMSPTNLFLKHLMEDHLSGLAHQQPQQQPFAPPPLPPPSQSSALSPSGGLVPTDWSTPNSTSSAGTPGSVDSTYPAGTMQAHPAHLHPQHVHPCVYPNGHLHHAHFSSPHAHAHQHSHQRVHSMAGHAGHSHDSHGHASHFCSIDPPQSGPPAIPHASRPQSSRSASTVSTARHHPYRPSVPSEGHAHSHAHVHTHAHGHAHGHTHTHHHDGRHLLPSVRASSSSRSSVSSAPGQPDAPTAHVCGYSGCGLIFDDTASLTEHLDKIHVGAGRKEYECGWAGCERAINGPVFKSKQKIMRHLQSHTGHKPFVCPICTQTFSEAATLQQHVKRHSKDKPHVCDHDGCDKAFPLASSLAIHKRTHDDVKPFQCPHCSRCFTEASNLNKHVRTHTGEKPFECKYPDCFKRFARPDQLTRHQGVHTRKEERDRLEACAAAAGGGLMGDQSGPEKDDEEGDSS